MFDAGGSHEEVGTVDAANLPALERGISRTVPVGEHEADALVGFARFCTEIAPQQRVHVAHLVVSPRVQYSFVFRVIRVHRQALAAPLELVPDVETGLPRFGEVLDSFDVENEHARPRTGRRLRAGRDVGAE